MNLMSENCSHNCGSCSSDCSSRKPADFLVPPNEHSKIKKVIAVVSGKGGVGKSLVTSLLAVLTARKGKETAVMDADITGPSIPKVFGIQIAGVVDVDNQRNGMAPGDQDLFDFLSHLAVAYQCNLHNTYECFRKFTLIFK